MSKRSEMPKAWVTGLGTVSPVGVGMEQSWRALLAGQVGIGRIEHFDTSEFPVKIAGLPAPYDPREYLPAPDCRKLESYAQMGVIAGLQAFEDAGLRPGDEWVDPARFSIVVGTGYGCTAVNAEAVIRLHEHGPRLTPVAAVYGAQDIVAGYLSTQLGAYGEAFSVSTACASGTVALGAALRLIRADVADAVLVIGADGKVEPRDLAIVSASGALTAQYNDDPRRASRPFDRDRSGFVLSAGGAALLVERSEKVAARGGRALGTVLGYGAASDAHHLTAPHPEGRGAIAAMRKALCDAGLSPESVDHVNAHGTGTRLNDEVEARAIRELFGRHSRNIAVTSTKSMTGHMIGAAGTFEAAATVLACLTGWVPATLNCDHLEFDLDVVRGEARLTHPEIAMSNSFGFGGHNATVVIGRCND